MTSELIPKHRPIHIGGMLAHCPRCGGTEFFFARKRLMKRTESATCVECGARCSYPQLLQHITNRIAKRAEAVLTAAEDIRAKVRGKGERNRK